MTVYQHILVPTDGTKLASKAIKSAVKLAAALHTRLTGVYVVPPLEHAAYTEAMMYMPAVMPKRQLEAAKKEGRRALAEIEVSAKLQDVPYDSIIVSAGSPWEGILKAAKSKRCDLIVMSSHGRRGLSGLLIGSETTKVLTHSKIPVLVCR